jgi:probable F420-dependent oxidoreductase
MKVGLILRFGEHYTGQTIRWSELRGLARQAEAVGFDTLWVDDHFFYEGEPLVAGGGRRGFFDAWMLLAALADATERVEIGPLVTCTAFRNPAVLAGVVNTVEDISGGRLVLGLGAGWHEPEFRALGLPFDHLASRFEEALAIMLPLLREGRVDFEGRYYQARELELRPSPVRPGGPPIWIGARGPRMMRLIARHADAFNAVWHTDPDQIRPRIADLEAACRDVGRDPGQIAVTAGAYVALPAPDGHAPAQMRPAIAGTPAEVAERLLAFRAVGVEHVTISLEPWDRHGLDRAAGLVEAIHRASSG